MNIVVINGTEQRGCTYEMTRAFLSALGDGHGFTEYYLPKDCPVFCTGCKACFFSGIGVCPHRRYTIPIWESVLAADLLVFTSPTYVFHATGQMKAMLDHYGSKWMAHSPEAPLFGKRAVIITNAIGMGMGKTARDIKDSLDFWGVARTYVVKQALFQVKWPEVDDRRKAAIRDKCRKVANKVNKPVPATPRLKIRLLFFIMKMAQKMIDKSEIKAGREHTADYLHWRQNGWLDGRKPWK
jgi:multimeric flavodoxin WrbA